MTLDTKKKLFMRRVDQSSSIAEAKRHGSDYFLCFTSEFPTPKQLRRLKEIVMVTADCMEGGADIEFWEE